MRALQILGLAFFKLCCLRLKPQDLPASWALLSLTLLLYIIASIILSLGQLSVAEAILSSLVETSLLVVLIGSLLHFTHHSGRIIQTLTALAGTNMLLGLLSIPFLWWLHQAKINHEDIAFPLLLLLGFLIWSWIVYAHVLRHALVISFFMGLAITLVMFYLTTNVLDQLFPFGG